MGFWVTLSTDHIWQSALVAVPLAVVVAAVCRLLPFRPTTRHSLWLVVLIWFVIAPVLPEAPLPGSVFDTVTFSSSDAALSNDAHLTAPTVALGRPPVMGDSSAGSSSDVARRDGLSAEESLVEKRPFFRSPPRLVYTPSPTLRRGRRIGYPPHARQADRAAGLTRRGPSSLESIRGDADRRIAVNDRPVNDLPAVDGADAVDNSAEGRLAGDEGTAWFGSESRWRWWVMGLAAVRAGMGRLPAVPAGIWLFGILVVAIVRSAGVMRYGRVIRGATPAPDSIRSMVADCARSLGLKRPPMAYLSDDRCSPMIWCGLKTRLVLPSQLWRDLDARGQRAVVIHELAHVARRDHWVCWVEIVLCCVYWWHPVVWWVRRRLHEEADDCCDAWVTWLLPKDRRAYAEALLTTKRFISLPPSVVMPAAGIGVLSGGGRRLARRISMVMTERVVPNRSLAGGVLAVVVMSVGWLVAPAHSSPVVADSASAVSNTIAGESPRDPSSSSLLVDLAAVPSSRVRAYQNGLMTSDKSTPDDVAIVTSGSEGSEQATTVPTDAANELFVSTRQPPRADSRAGGRLGEIEQQMSDLAARISELSVTIEKGFPDATFGGQISAAAPQPADENIVGRVYRLPAGKLQSLTTLMASADVPVRVVAGGDHIEVFATARQHSAIAAFVELIHPGAVVDLRTAAGNSPISTLRREQIRTLRRDIVEAGSDIEQVDEQASALEGEARSYRDAADALAAEAEAVRSAAATLIRSAGQHEQKAAGLDAGEREDAIVRAKALAERARMLQSKASAIQASAVELATEAEHLSRQAADYKAAAESTRALRQMLESKLRSLVNDGLTGQ